MSTPVLSPFADDYLAALLAQASQLISAEFHAVVLTSGFSVTEWRVLASLSGVDGMHVGRLAEVSVTKQPTVTRLLGQLEQKGLVERLIDEADLRTTLVRITPKGETIIADLIHQAKAHEANVLQPYGAQRANKLKTLLRQIIEEHRRAA